jgi:glycosyltransferase involved in cell wall biosynthesis
MYHGKYRSLRHIGVWLHFFIIPMTKPRILYLVHNFDNLAGVEIHTKTLWRELQPWFDTFIVHPEQAGPGQFSIVLRSGDGEQSRFPADPVPWPAAPYHLPKNEAALRQVIDSVSPDLIHIQHFIHWPLSVIDQCAAAGCPLFISFHDQFIFTPLFTMSGITDPREALTPHGSKLHFGSDISPYLRKRFDILGRSFAKAKKLIAPAPYLARLIEKNFQTPVDIIEIGIEPFQIETPYAQQLAAEEPAIRFGYAGSMIRQKGCGFLAQNFGEVHRRFPQAELWMFGGGSPPAVHFPGVRFLGGYQHEDLPSIMASFDVGVIPSVVAETFSMLLSEMWHAGHPVAVSDIGALGERVSDGINGKKFRPGDAADLVRSLVWFVENDEWRRWVIPRPRLLPAMIEEYRAVYQQALLRISAG